MEDIGIEDLVNWYLSSESVTNPIPTVYAPICILTLPTAADANLAFDATASSEFLIILYHSQYPMSASDGLDFGILPTNITTGYDDQPHVRSGMSGEVPQVPHNPGPKLVSPSLLLSLAATRSHPAHYYYRRRSSRPYRTQEAI